MAAPRSRAGSRRGLRRTQYTVTCANYGVIVTGLYCGRCVQNAHAYRSLAAIGYDIVHAVLYCDGKLRDTLPLFAFRPAT
jgi:hypothetical protein